MAILGSGRRGDLVSAPNRNELPWHFVASLIESIRKVRDGEDTIAGTRNACAPQNLAFELQGDALLKVARDGFGLVRYVQSPDRLHEFISRNTASTRSR